MGTDGLSIEEFGLSGELFLLKTDDKFIIVQILNAFILHVDQAPACIIKRSNLNERLVFKVELRCHRVTCDWVSLGEGCRVANPLSVLIRSSQPQYFVGRDANFEFIVACTYGEALWVRVCKRLTNDGKLDLLAMYFYSFAFT